MSEDEKIREKIKNLMSFGQVSANEKKSLSKRIGETCPPNTPESVKKILLVVFAPFYYITLKFSPPIINAIKDFYIEIQKIILARKKLDWEIERDKIILKIKILEKTKQ